MHSKDERTVMYTGYVCKGMVETPYRGVFPKRGGGVCFWPKFCNRVCKTLCTCARASPKRFWGCAPVVGLLSVEKSVWPIPASVVELLSVVEVRVDFFRARSRPGLEGSA